jgi:hypothetical protein
MRQALLTNISLMPLPFMNGILMESQNTTSLIPYNKLLVVNAYKTQTGTSDKSIVELLIIIFYGQLKGWWDNHN